MSLLIILFFFFFNDTATTEIYTLSLHDALPICQVFLDPVSLGRRRREQRVGFGLAQPAVEARRALIVELADRKSTRLNSSHRTISYAVFCLKKKTKKTRRKVSEVGEVFRYE